MTRVKKRKFYVIIVVVTCKSLNDTKLVCLRQPGVIMFRLLLYVVATTNQLRNRSPLMKVLKGVDVIQSTSYSFKHNQRAELIYYDNLC